MKEEGEHSASQLAVVLKLCLIGAHSLYTGYFFNFLYVAWIEQITVIITDKCYVYFCIHFVFKLNFIFSMISASY